MAENKTRVWLGVGSYLMMSATGLAAEIGDGGHLIVTESKHGSHAAVSEGGEGGEGGEAGYTSEDPDQVFAVNLLLSKGHLHIANELAIRGLWDNAAAHAQHPAAETYDKISPGLQQRGAAPFEAEMETLVGQITGKISGAPLDAAYSAVIKKIDAAYGAIDVSKRSAPAFVMSNAMALLKQAGAEYAIGVKDGKIDNLHEYQDSSGFIWVAEQMAANLQPSASPENQPVLKEIVAELAALKVFWSPDAKMGEAARPAAEMLSIISRIELKAGKIR